MTSMTRAKPAAEISALANRHAAQVRAHADHDEPFGLLDAGRVGLRVAELGPVGVVGFLDLVGGAVADEDGLAAPFDDDVFAFGDGGEVDFDFGLGEHVG